MSIFPRIVRLASYDRKLRLLLFLLHSEICNKAASAALSNWLTRETSHALWAIKIFWVLLGRNFKKIPLFLPFFSSIPPFLSSEPLWGKPHLEIYAWFSHPEDEDARAVNARPGSHHTHEARTYMCERKASLEHNWAIAKHTLCYVFLNCGFLQQFFQIVGFDGATKYAYMPLTCSLSCSPVATYAPIMYWKLRGRHSSYT